MFTVLIAIHLHGRRAVSSPDMYVHLYLLEKKHVIWNGRARLRSTAIGRSGRAADRCISSVSFRTVSCCIAGHWKHQTRLRWRRKPSTTTAATTTTTQAHCAPRRLFRLLMADARFQSAHHLDGSAENNGLVFFYFFMRPLRFSSVRACYSSDASFETLLRQDVSRSDDGQKKRQSSQTQHTQCA